MIASMTAFSRSEQQTTWGSFVCEIRSINHRYLEIYLHLPDSLRVLEMLIRDHIRARIKRGKIECTLQYKPIQQASLVVNESLVQALCQASEKIQTFLTHAAPVDPAEILRFPGVLEMPQAVVSEIQKPVLQLLDQTLQGLIATREREGAHLTTLFLQRIDTIEQELQQVHKRLPQILEDQRERILKRFLDASIELDPLRLEQEMVLFAQRCDVAEEIDRLHTHLKEVRRVIDKGGLVGRRMDFLLQELNREANTLGSKSTDTVMTHAAVEIKVLIEQIREQIQNIE